jgi:membrane-bound ClpP family serine protease
MWIITGVLLGLVCLTAVFGFHFGPHAHLVAGVIGLLVAGWLTYAVLNGGSRHALWWLLGADLIVSAAVGAMAWIGLSRSRTATKRYHLDSLEGSMGVVLSELAPEGIISVRGEQWSAVSVNGTAPASTQVQILRAAGVRLEVWGEDAGREPTNGLFSLETNAVEDEHT